ncbi:SRPBCC domain-containing protein [Mesorhizobium sp. CAU 1741]|uniref:SRPBCC family protein n=1 Tax=Mesorhizobium sp. CAU 1741 TaxID=3140366 RepID=UPI00325A832B
MTTETVSLQVKRRFAASSERVFDSWIVPEIARRWIFSDQNGEIVSARVDARVGGTFSFVRRDANGDLEHVGEYLEIDRPRRLVFTFAVPSISPEYDRVTIEIVRLDTGCELTLTSEMSPAIFAEWGEQTKAGWTRMLDGLAVLVEG